MRRETAAATHFRTPALPHFRLIDTPPEPGAWNMALDDALMESVRRGGAPVLRVYRWRPRCLSLGRNQPGRGWYDEERLRERGVDVVRRPTGGRAVLHDRELTYSVALPAGLLGSARATYHAVNGALVAGVRRLGVAAELQPRTARRAPVPSLAPCFREPAEGEVVVGGRKLIGSALRHGGGAILQHGSLLLEGSQAEVSDLARVRAASRDEDPVVLADLLSSLPAWAEIVAALAAGWRDTFHVPLHPDEPSAAEREHAALRRRHYADPAWTWRR